MHISELLDKSSKLKIQKQVFINDTYMWVELARSAINDLPDDKMEFLTPKAGKPQQLRTISRTNPETTKSKPKQ